YFPEVLISRALTESEKNLLFSCSHDERLRQECFWRLWTLKEAYVKESGIGVDTDLKAFSFTFDPSITPETGTPAEVKCSNPEVSCFQVFLKSGHIVSLCTGHTPESFVVDVVEKIDLCHDIAEDNNSEHDPHS
ncbi:MAG: 4'-phosphopantetheinyl transferase superfamily protein, partial [Oscillospiraceae bacterium]|nr:4'-phosphopantetheinyl transferase superfamily protein [Oscillospiraceae bacterium]